MNILYINTHDTGRYIQPYGYPIPTPNLQRLAEQGTLFRNAYCTAPTCSPSRSGLLTGRMPHNNGMWGLTHRGFSLFNPEEHIASFLNHNGFETTLCGIQHEAEDPYTLGYQRILDGQDYSMSNCNREWRSFDIGNAGLVADYLNEKHEKPFFLAFGIFNTHRKFPDLPENFNSDYIQPPSPIFDSHENRRDMAAYIESARIVDECVGIVMDALKKSGHEDDTIVLFTTDHGIAFPEMKGTMYDTGIGVSLILKYKDNARAGSVCDTLVSHLDIFPTFCQLVGVQQPEGLQGISICPILDGSHEAVRKEIYAESNYHVTYEPKRCVRTDRFKYIRSYSRYNKPMPANTDDCIDKKRRIEIGYYSRTHEREFLFDLVSDPYERVNLIDNPDLAQVREELSAKLNAWMEKTDDPLLKGVMIPPDGAKVNYPSSLTPAEKVFIQNWLELE